MMAFPLNKFKVFESLSRIWKKPFSTLFLLISLITTTMEKVLVLPGTNQVNHHTYTARLGHDRSLGEKTLTNPLGNRITILLQWPKNRLIVSVERTSNTLRLRKRSLSVNGSFGIETIVIGTIATRVLIVVVTMHLTNRLFEWIT